MVHLPSLKVVFPGIVILFDLNAINVAWYDIFSNFWQWNTYGFWAWDENMTPLVSD